jgi:hypothetical protein
MSQNALRLPVNPNLDFDSGSVIFQERKEKRRTETRTDLLSTLPVQVISHIFYHACKPIYGNRKWHRDCDPLLLGQLSRRYRQCAWATSELWATIIIQVIPNKVAVQTQLLEEWLARTRGRPIDIYFGIETRVPMHISLFLSNPTGDNKQPPIVPMINLLAKHSRHWRCIAFRIPALWCSFFDPLSYWDFTMSDNEVTQPVPKQKLLDLPLLVSASFHREDLPIVHKRTDLDLTLAPSLSICRFEMNTITFKRFSVKQITTLVFDHVYDIDLHDLLPRFPNLQALFVHSAIFPKTTLSRTTTHQKLCKPEINTSWDHLLVPILVSVILPGLESLSI